MTRLLPSTPFFFLKKSALIAMVAMVLIAPTQWLRAQKGDKPGEDETPPPRHFTLPPTAPLSPEEEQKTIKVPAGFRVELVASEPLVQAPVAMAFDVKGRLWVCEMQAYMMNVDGKNEDAPICDIAILEDTKGTGKMDKRTVFLDHLKLPRVIAVARDGVFICEPPHLWFCREKDGKLVEKIDADPTYATIGTVEHMANGMMWGMDNWFYNAKSAFRYRFDETGTVKKSPSPVHGQWGITQDDWGRIFYNTNPKHLLGDLVPAHYLWRNRNFRDASGANIEVAKDNSTHPIRPTPGVNRGYKREEVRDDGTLARNTAACGPVIYRGDLFAREFYGNAFACEPAGNLIMRDIISDANATLTATRAGKSEFAASTDERFRPVNLYNGPDGALWVVDMYRGIIQDKVFVTTYLRKEILSRELEQPLDRGRIWRIVPENAKPGALPKLEDASPAALVKKLENGNGWWRDTAQRMIVESGDKSIVPDLKKIAATSKHPAVRLQALWTLQGLDAIDEPTIFAALKDPHPKVRAGAVRLSEPFLSETSNLTPRILSMTNDPAPDVRLQLALTLGEIKGDAAEAAMAKLLETSAENQYIRDAVITGLQSRELEFLQKLLVQKSWQQKTPGRAETIATLARCIFAEAKPERITQLLDTIVAQKGWQQITLLDGLIAPTLKKGKKVRPVVLPNEPPALAKLAADAALKNRAEKISPLFVWIGKPGYNPPKVTPLTAAQQKLYDEGKEIFAQTCAGCHQPDGRGQEGLAPPLVNSDWLLGPPQRTARIVLQGVTGDISVDGRTYSMEMPPLNVLTDEQIAAILTYARRDWGHTAAPVEPEFIAKIREATKSHTSSWTAKELQALK